MEKTIRILCLTDESDAESIRSILKAAGFSMDMRRVDLHDEFESALRSGEYDLILANYQLPHCDGFAALKLVREVGVDVPFIFVSEPPGEEMVIRAFTEGAAGYVLKDGMERLPHVVRRVLDEMEERHVQHKSNEEVRSREARIRHVLEYCQDTVYQRNLQMDRYDYISSTIFDITGYTSNEIIDLPFDAILEMIHPDDRVVIKKMLADASKNTGISYQMDFRFRHRDGSYRWFQDNIRVNVDSNGAPLYRVGVIRDITEQKTATESLRASEERYHSIITAMSEGVVFQRTDGMIVSANPGAERVLGLTFDQMIGRTSMDPRWQSIHEDGSPFPGDDHPAMVTLRTGVSQRDVIMGVHKPDGSLSWISINSELAITPGLKYPAVWLPHLRTSLNIRLLKMRCELARSATAH